MSLLLFLQVRFGKHGLLVKSDPDHRQSNLSPDWKHFLLWLRIFRIFIHSLSPLSRISKIHDLPSGSVDS